MLTPFESGPVLAPVIYPDRGFSPGAAFLSSLSFPISLVRLFVRSFIHLFCKQTKVSEGGISKRFGYSRGRAGGSKGRGGKGREGEGEGGVR